MLRQFIFCHIEIEVANQACYLKLSPLVDTGPTSASTDPCTRGVWVEVTWRDRSDIESHGSHTLGRPQRGSCQFCVMRLRTAMACSSLTAALRVFYPGPVRCLFVCCLMSQQHASAPQGRICTDNFTCCHTEIEVADQTFYLTQSQYTDTGPTSPSANPITPGAWQGSHWSANF